MQVRMDFISSLHINNLFKRWNEPGHTTKGNKCYANIIYTHVPHIYSLQKERWLHYMYRITEINDIMYNIYSFRFKIIVIIIVWSLFSTSHTNPHRHIYTALPSVLFVCLYSNKCLLPNLDSLSKMEVETLQQQHHLNDSS